MAIDIRIPTRHFLPVLIAMHLVLQPMAAREAGGKNRTREISERLDVKWGVKRKGADP